MKVIETLADIETNLRQLEIYLASADTADREFAQDLVRRGLCFIAAPRAGGLLFGPSRFVGYQNNSRTEHSANNEKDGKETNHHDCASHGVGRGCRLGGGISPVLPTDWRPVP